MADYYLSAAGDDTNGGSAASPWKTINRLNDAFTAHAIQLNDRVHLRRGDTFYGAIRPYAGYPDDGDDWVSIGAYGDEASPPRLAGYKNLNIASGWVQHDANTWKIDISYSTSGVNYTGYDSKPGTATGDASVGILIVDGVIKANLKENLADLTNQWDYYMDGIWHAGTTLYVRSSAKPTTLAADIRCTVAVDGIDLFGSAIQVSDLEIDGFGGSGAMAFVTCKRARFLRNRVHHIGGSFLNPGERYGNGFTTYTDTQGFYAENNIVHDVYDTAWSIQGGTAGANTHFENVTWRRNLTYRCCQAEEYWYLGTGAGFVNCLSEYNTNLFPGYGFGADVRPNTRVRVAQLTYLLGNEDWTIPTTIELPTVRRNIYYHPRGPFSYHATDNPNDFKSDYNAILLQPGTKMVDQTSETVEDANAWLHTVDRDQHSLIATLADTISGTTITDADVTAAIANLDHLAPMGQLVGGKVLPIHGPWR